MSLKTEVDKSGINKLKSVPTNLSNLKSKVDILDIEKLETTPVNLSRQSNVVKNDVEIKNNEDKIPDITNLATKTLTLHKLAVENFATRLAQANLVTKTNFDEKLKNLTKNINSNKTKHLIVENDFKKLETFDSIYFRGKNYFEDDGTQN